MRVARSPRLYALVALLFSSSCARTTKPAPADAGAEARPRYGALMGEIGRRWELAGRAASANRFELAAFEVGEIEELFTEDLPRAELPKEGPSAQLPSLATAWVNTHLRPLKQSLEKRDAAPFAAEFERASGTCNACHKASEHGFLEIPTVVGKNVPSLDPLPAASTGR